MIESGEADGDASTASRARTLGPGDYFGEIALIDDGAADARRSRPTPTCTARASPRGSSARSSSRTPPIAWKLLQTLAKRLRGLAVTSRASSEVSGIHFSDREREAFAREEDEAEPEADRRLDRLQAEPEGDAVPVVDAVRQERGATAAWTRPMFPGQNGRIMTTFMTTSTSAAAASGGWIPNASIVV